MKNSTRTGVGRTPVGSHDIAPHPSADCLTKQAGQYLFNGLREPVDSAWRQLALCQLNFTPGIPYVFTWYPF